MASKRTPLAVLEKSRLAKKNLGAGSASAALVAAVFNDVEMLERLETLGSLRSSAGAVTVSYTIGDEDIAVVNAALDVGAADFLRLWVSKFQARGVPTGAISAAAWARHWTSLCR